uniref:RING-type E3 ubiquitin transferase n=1 Tax=Kalanchoe fedtschenkoi TaxID=63787 RepID=A0A7N0VKB2_KALFE
MESPKPVGEDAVVAIAVNKGVFSRTAVKWAAENLLEGGRSVKLVHVRRRALPFKNTVRQARHIKGSGGRDLHDDLRHGYKELLEMRARENLHPLQSYFKKKKIQSDLVILEDNDTVGAIADFVLAHHVDVLVMGAGSQKLLKKLKGTNVASRVSKKAPYFCTVYIIAKGILQSERSASSTVEPLSGNIVKIVEYESSYPEMKNSGHTTYSGSSVSSGTGQLGRDLDTKFEVRELCDSSSSGDSADSSGCSLGSFETSYPLSNGSNWSVGSSVSSPLDSVRDSMVISLGTNEAEAQKLASPAKRFQGYRAYSTSEIADATNLFSQSQMIGRGSYGRVYACLLDHTPVAVKVLDPHVANQDKLIFQRVAETLAATRHPNVVLLLGACPEQSCLVYEYMENGSLEDCLYCNGNALALPWQVRFRMVADIGSALVSLHHTKPEPIVHRGLTSRNILLDGSYAAKLSDVGLRTVLNPSAAYQVTQKSLSQSERASFIDPECRESGALDPASDVYSFGVVMLQMLTARSPVGLIGQVKTAINERTLVSILDPAINTMPVGAALSFAKLALQCSEPKPSDRPDLALYVLPELNKLKRRAQAS